MPRKSKRQLALEASIPEATEGKNYLLPNELAVLVNTHIDKEKYHYVDLVKALNLKGWCTKRGKFIEVGHLYRARVKHGTQPRKPRNTTAGTYALPTETSIDWEFVSTVASSKFDANLKREVLLKVLQ
jgi:hypothetical protein